MKNIKIIFTGGTIAMRTNSDGLLVPAVSGADLVASIPALQETARISSIQFSNIPSAQITPELMLQLRSSIINELAQEETAGIVIVHGTDTMEETAFFLDASLSNDKPIVLTGAMRSNDYPQPDGASNLLNAVKVAAADSSRGRGVMVVMNGEVHSARQVRKTHTSDVCAFTSPQILGSVSSEVVFLSPLQKATPCINVPRETLALPRVDIALMYTGADATQINTSIAAGAQAIIVQAVGASSVNLELYGAIAHAISQGVDVVVASRSPYGICEPVYGYTGGGQSLAALGAVFAHDLPAHKARLYAQLLLLDPSTTSLPAGFANLTHKAL